MWNYLVTLCKRFQIDFCATVWLPLGHFLQISGISRNNWIFMSLRFLCVILASAFTIINCKEGVNSNDDFNGG